MVWTKGVSGCSVKSISEAISESGIRGMNSGKVFVGLCAKSARLRRLGLLKTTADIGGRIAVRLLAGSAHRRPLWL